MGNLVMLLAVHSYTALGAVLGLPGLGVRGGRGASR